MPEPVRPEPSGIDLEIIEYAGKNSPIVLRDNRTGEIRINGHAVYASDEQPIVIHEMAFGQAAMVTMTLFLRSLSIRSEPGPEPPPEA